MYKAYTLLITNASAHAKTAASAKEFARNKNGALLKEDTAPAKFKPNFPLLPSFRSICDRTVFIRTLRKFAPFSAFIYGVLIMKVIVNEGHKGFLFKNGVFVKMLGAGRYFTFGGKTIKVAEIGDDEINVLATDTRIFLRDPEFVAQTVESEAKSGELTLHFVNGNYVGKLSAGKHFFWKENREHTFVRVDLSNPVFPEDFPDYLYSNPLFSPYVCKIEVSEKQKGLLFYDKKFVKLLDAGTYYFVKGTVKVEAEFVETCLLQQDIVGQEILTSDKVALRVNCVCSYKITDFIKVKTQTDDYKNQLHTAVQLALRDYVGERRLDEILAAKNEMSAYLKDRLKAKGKELFLEIDEAAVKDIILPGEIRDIMNTVLVAEKRAQANVITRREEVASTRSLLNTAHLMDENKTLYKLKELEYIERICEKVGNINLNGGGDLLSQLTAALGRNNEK